jgi:hypothetical protein
MDFVVKKTSSVGAKHGSKAVKIQTTVGGHIEGDPASPKDDGLSAMGQSRISRNDWIGFGSCGDGSGEVAVGGNTGIGRLDVVTDPEYGRAQSESTSGMRGTKRGRSAESEEVRNMPIKKCTPCHESKKWCDGKLQCGRCQDMGFECFRTNCPDWADCTRTICSRMHPGELEELKSSVGVKKARVGDADCYPPATPASGR